MAHEIRLPASPTTPRTARRFVEDVFPPAAVARLDDAKLLVSELVTNAVARALSPVELRVTEYGSAVRVEVHDRSERLPVPTPAPLDAESGRGLTIVERLADRWGTDRVPETGKSVWFELNT